MADILVTYWPLTSKIKWYAIHIKIRYKLEKLDKICFFDNFGVGHFDFKMVDSLTQNHKLPLLGTITMQYKIKAPETLAVRDS